MSMARNTWRGDSWGSAPAECDKLHNRLVWDLGEDEDPLDEDFAGLAELLLSPMFGEKPQ